ncbi:MAG TPA: hypothetical protein VNN62_13875 [Methylomirabilota bacterium]|jgi:hypothetical protein|nr:hypothetical protein [Methylomirabilota bacterium]
MQECEYGGASKGPAAPASSRSEAVYEPSSFVENDEFFPLTLFEVSKPLFDLAMMHAFRVMHCSPPCHDVVKKDCDSAG